MKKIILIALFTFIFLVTGCTNIDDYIPLETYTNEVALYESRLEEAKSETKAKSIEITELKERLDNLVTHWTLSKEETKKYKDLIANLNELLKNIYYGYGENENWILDGFTAFSIEYQGNYYLITAGHCVEDYDMGRMTNFKFKANFSNNWIYPKLLTYENDYINGNDYAIFYSDKIKTGLNYDLNNTEPDYRLGINKLIQENNNWGIAGECGSPIVDLNGEVIGVHVGYLTDIDLVIEAIDNLE